MQKIEKLTAAGFPYAVRNGVVIVDFFTRCSGNCFHQKRIIESMVDREKFPEAVRVTKIDVDEAPVIAAKFEVDAVPTLLVFQHGSEVCRLTGLIDEAELLNAIPKNQNK